MKKSSTIFLQVVIVLIGIGALALLLWEPHIEGVNAHATFFEMYFDPFIALCISGPFRFSWHSIRHSRCWDMPDKIKYSRKRP
jgi:hypothetical protein